MPSSDSSGWDPRTVGTLLIFYLFGVGAAAVIVLIVNFPDTSGDAEVTQQRLLLLALTAGIAGSFIHAGQSLSSFLGNQQFKNSWTAWYLLRPWIGGVLGVAVVLVYSAFSSDARCLQGACIVVALALLGGWFSKVTADKMQEIFEAVLKSHADQSRLDKLTPPAQPIIERLEPASLPAGQSAVTIHGQNFLDGAVAIVDRLEVAAQWISDKQLKITLPSALPRTSGRSIPVRVKNPSGATPLSQPMDLRFS